ncbi:DUF2797 domain-containing protein, partial [Streptomyces sp. NPDC005784]|uniref:DUF2797 domain-containing protein n=1 Tax=Streptomyces sp. NPDC005784 TaxID=3364731 RepID=UPI0036767D4E
GGGGGGGGGRGGGGGGGGRRGARGGGGGGGGGAPPPHSVAADTLADDQRPYHVYLAWFGPGMVKVGITRVERGSTRLLEQGAVTFSWLGQGPLMAARRAEELLRAALKVPDRIPYADKRAVRAALPGPEERVAEIRELHARVGDLDGWPESLRRASFEPVDHTDVFGLAGLPPARGVVRELVAGGAISGELCGAAGPDLHLLTGRGVVVLDTRLMTGWDLTGVGEVGGDGDGDGSSGITFPVRESRAPDAGVQDGLF